jgi:dihydrofolate reductase
MDVSLIVAMDRRGLIGRDGTMPWHLPRDLRRFKECTLGHPVIMGRRTLDSIGGRLKGRYNIILTRNQDYAPPGCGVAHSVDEALRLAAEHQKAEGGSPGDVMVIGGGIVFREMLPLCTKALVTLVEGDFEGDTYFPLEEFLSRPWQLESSEYCPADEKNPYPHWFMVARLQATRALANGGADVAGWIDQPWPTSCH